MRSAPRDFDYARDHERDLNDRQRQVLELIARGLTNGQIAERLGMTLDGAKWNVSEILTKLGLGSREDAADFWRREHAGPRGLRRTLAAIPLWARLTAGAGATAVVVAVLAIMLLDQGESRAEPGAGVWLAYAAQPLPQPGPSPLHVINLETDERATLAPNDRTAILEWSPDASRLAAMTLNLDSPNEADQGEWLRFWSAPNWTELNALHNRADGEASITRFILDIAWSPDSSRLAAFRGNTISIYDADGGLLGDVKGTPDTSGGTGGTGHGLANTQWSPDSELVAVIRNDLLLIADRDGHGGEHDLPPRLPGQLGQAEFLDWVGPRQLRVMLADQAATATVYTGEVSANGVAWDNGQQMPIGQVRSFDLSRADEFERMVPEGRYGGTFPTADRTAEMSILQSPQAQNVMTRAVWLIIDAEGQQTRVSLGEVASFGSFTTLDVVVTPAWRGDLPPEVDLRSLAPVPSVARTPVPRPSPVPTPNAATQTAAAVIPTSEGPTRETFATTPEPGITVIPYPTPKGERVQPQVAGLPLFPGAEEIDGFTGNVDGTESAIQMYATDASPEEVTTFYEQELLAQGYRSTGGSYGVTGAQDNYIRGRDRVLISTTYIPRPEAKQEPGEQLYGFRGKGRRFLEGADGKTWFFIITIHAD